MSNNIGQVLKTYLNESQIPRKSNFTACVSSTLVQVKLFRRDCLASYKLMFFFWFQTLDNFFIHTASLFSTTIFVHSQCIAISSYIFNSSTSFCLFLPISELKNFWILGSTVVEKLYFVGNIITDVVRK